MPTIALPLLLQAAAGPLPAVERAPEPHQLDYVITQAGLEPPTFDGGRTEFECADVDGDGYVDLVSVGDHGSPYINTDQHGVMVWRGDGQGGWSLVMTGDFGYGGVAVGDVNGDGFEDVGYGVHHDYSATDLGDQLVEVALGDGTAAAWTPWDDGLASTGETWGMFGTDFGDVDADGDLDLAVNSFGCCSGTRVYQNGGDGTWSPAYVGAGANSDMDVLFCDFDGDGHLDVLTANEVGRAVRGDGTGGFVDAGLDVGGYSGIAAGDVDGDGADEVASVSGGAVRLYRWAPGDVWSQVGDAFAAAQSIQLSQLVDLDVDGDVDLVAFGSGTVTFWLNDGEGGFGPGFGGVLPGSGSKIGEAFEVSSDLDCNGYPDMVVLQDEGSVFGGGGNELYAVYESSTPEESWARVTAPGPGRVWRAGQARFVRWASALVDPGAGTGTATVELSTSGLGGPWVVLGSGANSGRMQVVVPGGVASEACYLRVRVELPGGGGVWGYGSGAFEIR